MSGTSNAGFKRKDNTKPRKPKSSVMPDPNPHSTDPIVSNIESLVDVSFKPMFKEMWERGRGNIAAFSSDFLDITLHQGQVKWMHEHAWANERMLSSGNRFGKTYAASVKLLHNAFYQIRPPQYAELTNEYVALNLSLTIDMAKIATDYCLSHGLSSKIFRRFIIENEVKTAPFPLIPIGTPKSQRVGAFHSEIWARSSAKDARYLLGRKFDFVNYDECARDPHGDKILDEVLRMRLADRSGRIDMTSTAAGRNWFYLAYRRGIEDAEHLHYFSMTGTSFDNPNIDHDRVRQNEAVMSETWKAQNIYGGFSDASNVFFRPHVESMYEGIEYKCCTRYQELDSLNVPTDAKYIMAIDWALKRDETVIMVARVDENRGNEKWSDGIIKDHYPIVYCQGFGVKENGERYGWDELKNIAVLINRRFNQAECLFDSTGMAGEMIYSDLSNLGMINHNGYDFAGNNGIAKDQLILVAQQALQNKVFIFPFNIQTAQLVDQLLMYDRNDKNLATDYVFAFCLLAEQLRRSHLPISEILSLPLYFSMGKRSVGTNALHPFDRTYEIRTVDYSPKPSLSDSDFVLSSTGYVKPETPPA